MTGNIFGLSTLILLSLSKNKYNTACRTVMCKTCIITYNTFQVLLLLFENVSYGNIICRTYAVYITKTIKDKNVLAILHFAISFPQFTECGGLSYIAASFHSKIFYIYTVWRQR